MENLNENGRASRRIKTVAELEKALSWASGTEHYYVLFSGAKLKYTDGVKHMAEIAEAYWLLYLLTSKVPELYLRKPHLRDFAIVRLTVPEGGLDAKVEILSDDGNSLKVEDTIQIHYTDFPTGVFEMYLENFVILLKTEH